MRGERLREVLPGQGAGEGEVAHVAVVHLLGDLSHGGPAGRVRGRRGEGTEGVAHGAHGEGREARGGQEGPRGAEHIGRLLPLLPLGPPVLEPHLICGGGGQGNMCISNRITPDWGRWGGGMREHASVVESHLVWGERGGQGNICISNKITPGLLGGGGT